ncbi:hypothetical protein CL622_08095 [archaeon]|nr:hypothetical protein [archaeon]|tara:strand:+ start:2100 stop:2567 length:468 start_codon:yes stop_codon:yes gene_type:complete
MQQLKELITTANKHIRTADHLAYMTYPLIKDPKLIIKIAEHVYHAMKVGIEAVVFYERLYKRISQVGDEFTAKYDLFKTKCAKRYAIDSTQILAFEDLNTILKEHKDSQVSFIREQKLVICSDQFQNIRTLTIERVKTFLNLAKQFIVKTNQIVR